MLSSMDLNPLEPGTYPNVERVDTAKGHHYKNGSKRVRNVTTILHGGIPKNLTRWAAKLAAQSMYDQLVDPAGVPESKDELLLRAAKAPDDVKTTAGNRGTLVHSYAEELVRGYEPEIPPGLVPWTDGVSLFLQDTDWRTFASEVVVWSDDPWYAGTIDVLFEDEQGRLRLTDIKTSKGVYQEMALQLAAYRHAKYVRIGEDVYRMPHVYSAGIIHLPGDHGYDYYAANTSDETFDVFRAVHQVSGWLGLDKEEVLTRWDVKKEDRRERRGDFPKTVKRKQQKEAM